MYNFNVDHADDLGNGLVVGWFGNDGWKKDATDIEWETFSHLFATSIPWYLMHFVAAQYTKKFNKKV